MDEPEKPFERRRLWAAAECLEDGCTRRPLARDLCSRHYQSRKKAGTLPPTVRAELIGTKCTIEGCIKKAVSHRMCGRHVRRANRYSLGKDELELVDAVTECESCGGPPDHVDHDHETGDVRGILCTSCNTALGLLKDSEDRILALYRYVVTKC